LAIAAVNGPCSVTVAGDAAALTNVLEQLRGRDIVAQRLDVSHAFHSPLVDPILPELEQLADRMPTRPLQRGLICNLRGRLLRPGDRVDGAYWR
jgi:acyl transferase domain-containing protein